MFQILSRPDYYAGLCGHLQCEVVERHISGAPAALRSLCVLFITDLHVTARTTDEDLYRFVRRVAALEPDILLWGGDFADRQAHAVRLFAHLSELKPSMGGFAVLGNNDREAWPDVGVLQATADSAGIRLLINETIRLDAGDASILIGGIDDYKHGNPDPSGLFQGGRGEGAYRILLSHYPIPVNPMPDLMLCGHTHGGQFNLAGITPYAIGFERILPSRPHCRYIEGLHEAGGGRLLVSKGIGASRIPLRIGVKPEIDRLVFE